MSASALAARLARSSEDFDLIVVGAGINALGLAVLLGEAGWRVLVLERNEVPGGSVRTMQLTLPGFHHDVGAMNLGTFVGSPFFAERRAALAALGAEFAVSDHPNGVLLPDGRFLGFTTDLDRNLEAIAAFSEADAQAWRTWRADFDRVAPVLGAILGSPAAASGPLDYVFGRGVEIPDGARTAARDVLLDSLRSLLSARFESPALRALVAAWGLHIDYAPDVSGGCWMPFLETNADERFGIPLAKGGSGRLTAALAAMVVEKGGEVRTGAEVRRVVIEEGAAVGVELADGDLLRSKRGVAAGVTPTALLRLTDGALSDEQARRARNWRYGPGTMVLHLACDALPAWEATDARESFYVHLTSSLDHQARVYQQWQAGLLSDDPFVVVGQPTLVDPSRAPEGKHVLWVMVRCVPAEIRGDAAGEIGGRSWTSEVVQAFAERVLDKVERHAPGLRDGILARAVHSPLELQRLNPNIVGGDINSGSQHLSQFYGHRPFPDAPNHQTSIPGLYLCGASTFPGGGAAVGSGALLAQHLLASDR